MRHRSVLTRVFSCASSQQTASMTNSLIHRRFSTIQLRASANSRCRFTVRGPSERNFSSRKGCRLPAAAIAPSLATRNSPVLANQSNSYYNHRIRDALQRRDAQEVMRVLTNVRAQQQQTHVPILWYTTYDEILYFWSQQTPMKHQQLQQIIVLLDEMVHFQRVNSRSFNTVLVACSKRRDLKKALSVLEKMKFAGKLPGAFAYANVINCCAKKSGNVVTAEQLWQEMCREGIEPSIEAVNCMLRVYQRSHGRSHQALAFVTQVIKEFGLNPDAITVSTLVSCLLKDGNTEDVLGFLESAVETDLPIEIGVWNAVLHQCRQLSRWNDATRTEMLMRRQQDDGRNVETARQLKLNDVIDSTAAPSTSRLPSLSSANCLSLISSRVQQKETMKALRRDPQKYLNGLIEDFQAGSLERLNTLCQQLDGLKDWKRMINSSTINEVEQFFDLLETLQSEHEASSEINDATFQNLYDLYLIALGKAGLVDKAIKVLDRMIARGSVEPANFNNVLMACSRENRLVEAQQTLEKMKHTARLLGQCAPSTLTYNILINCCTLDGDIDTANKFYEELQSKGLSPDRITLNAMLKVYANGFKREPTHVHQHMSTSDAKESISGAEAVLTLFENCVKNNRLVPDSITYFTLFRSFLLEVKNDAFHADNTELDQRVVAFINDTCRNAPIASLNTGVINAGIDFFQSCGEVNQAFELFNIMKVRGIEHNDDTLGLLFAACSRANQAQVGLNFLHHLMDQESYQPSIDVLNGAIQLCASSNSPEDAVEIFNGIQGSGNLKPNEASYINVIHAFARTGDVSSAWNFAGRLKQEFGKASIDALNRVLQACVVARDLFAAVDVFAYMKSEVDLDLNIDSYNLLLRILAQRKRTAEGEGYSYDDDDDDDDNDYVEADESKRSYISAENIEQEFRRPEGLGNDEFVNVRPVIMELFEEMRRDGVMPNTVTYKRAMVACSIRNDHDGVILLFDDLLHNRNGDVPISNLTSDSCLSVYLNACCHLNDVDRLKELIQLLREWHYQTRMPTSARVLLNLLNALEKLGEWKRALPILREMENWFGVRPNVVFFNRVMEMCNTANEFQFVDPIFLTMQNAVAYRIYPNAESYIQVIYAAEQREEWVRATNLFMEMQQKCPNEEILPRLLQKSALGRYSQRHGEIPN